VCTTAGRVETAQIGDIVDLTAVSCLCVSLGPVVRTARLHWRLLSKDRVEVLFEYERVLFFKTAENLSERRGEVQDQDRSLLPHASSRYSAPHLDLRHNFGILPDIIHDRERHRSGIHHSNHLEPNVRRSGSQRDEPARKRRHRLLVSCEYLEQQSRRERSARSTWRTRDRKRL
jgi:hypothetical protein